MVYRAHLSEPQRPRVTALVLGALRSQQARGMRISNQVATLEVAKAEFEANWKQWKAWAKLEETG